jgi:hypothetical protein
MVSAAKATTLSLLVALFLAGCSDGNSDPAPTETCAMYPGLMPGQAQHPVTPCRSNAQ